MQLICITSFTSTAGEAVVDFNYKNMVVVFNLGFTGVVSLLSACSAPMDTNLLSNIHKLFSERIDIFSSVEFNKVSTGLRQSAVKVICYVQYTHSPLCCPRSL